MLQQQNIDFLKKQITNVKVEEYKTLKILTGFNKQKNPILYVWRGRQKNPFHRYYYKNVEKRNLSLKSLKIGEDNLQQHKEERRKKRKSFLPIFDVGDIYVGSWGYEQTNVNSYQVIKVLSKHYALVREIGNNSIEGSEGFDSCDIYPDKDNFIESEKAFRVKVGMYGIVINSVITASKWDGKRKYYKSWYY